MENKVYHPEAIAYKRGVGVVICLCLTSLLLSGIFLTVINDIYAFVKPDTEITIEITEGLNDIGLAKALHDNGVISNPVVFALYLRSKNKSSYVSELSGKWQLNTSMSYREIVKAFFY